MEVKTLDSNQSLSGSKTVCLAALALFLFTVMAAGIFIFLTGYSNLAAGFTLSFVTGLSMIFLPCTLPLAFIALIAVHERVKKGIIMALLFLAGMVVAFGIYGIAFAYTGDMHALSAVNANAGILLGSVVYAHGISRLGLAGMKIPRVKAFPGSTGEYLRMFFIGLLVANFDMCCLNPVFYVITWHIMDIANIFTGWSIMAAYGAGKAMPVIFLIILGILGINARTGIKKISLSRKTADWALMFLGVFLLTVGVFHEWYTKSAFHITWDSVLISLSDGRIGEVEIANHAMHEIAPQWLGPYVFILLLALPVILHFYMQKKKRS